jgi:hypothetical protein
LAKTHRIPEEHGRNAFATGRCKCDEICRPASRAYSRARDRQRGVKEANYKSWTAEEIKILETSELSNLELVSLLPGRTLSAITHKRTMIGAGLLQRGLPITRPGNRGRAAWNRGTATKTPLPELVRGSRIKNTKTGTIYRICGVHMESDPPYVWLDRVDTMYSRLLKRTIKELSDKYEGLKPDQNKNANVSSGDSAEALAM